MIAVLIGFVAAGFLFNLSDSSYRASERYESARREEIKQSIRLARSRRSYHPCGG